MDDIGREWREKLEENRQSVKNKSSEEMKIEDLQDTPRKIQDRNMKSFKDL
jgi:hypothetical protein